MIILYTSLFNKISDLCGIPQKFFNDVFCILTSNIINNITVFAANIVIARNFNHEFFGLYSVAVNIALLTLTLSEFGMNYSMIRLYKKHVKNHPRSRAILLANFYFKIFMLLILVIIGLLTGRLFASLIMHDDSRWCLVTVAFFCGGILGIWSFTRAYFQAMEEFRLIALHTLVYAVLRVSFLCMMISFSYFASEVWFLLAIYVFPLSIILLWGLMTFNNSFSIYPVRLEELLDAGAESIQYSWSVALTGISFVLIQQSMVYIVSIIGGVKQVALLSAGLVFTAVFGMINDAITQVLFSKISSLPTERIDEYKKRLSRLAPFYIMGCVIIIASLSLAMMLFLDDRYIKSLSIFWVTSVATAGTAFISYYSLVMHTIQRPQLGAYVNVVTLISVCICSVFLMKYVSLLAVTVAYMLALIIGEFFKAMLVNRAVSNSSLKE